MTNGPPEAEGKERIWGRLRRRKVVQWGIAYAAGAWGLLQGLEYVSSTFEWPRQIQQFSTLGLLIGLPVALVVAWYHGDRGEQRVSGAELIIITLLFLLGGGIFWRYERANEMASIAPPAASSMSTAMAVDEHSVAVLPFVNMSPDKEQEYFADGISEELLNLLAQVPELRVIARTSSFSFKGKDVDIAEIARRLNVAHVLEGSVRKSGNTIRITAQLVRTSDSSHLWSQTYDRQMTDVFAVQDEIAAEVVKTLEIKLLSGETSAPASSEDVEAYALLLKGRFFAQRRLQADFERAIEYLHRSVELKPAYAPAWVDLANAYMDQADSGYSASAEGYERALEAVEKALSLDSNLSAAHSAMGWIQGARGDWEAAEASNRRSLALEPRNADALRRAGVLASELGRMNEALALIRKSIEVDPLAQTGYEYLGYVLRATGQYRDAEVAFRKAQELSPDAGAYTVSLGLCLLLEGRPAEALPLIEQTTDEPWRLYGRSLAYHSLDQQSASDSALALLEERYAAAWPFHIAEVYAWRNENDRAFEWLDRAFAQRDALLADLQLSPFVRRLASDPRYKTLSRKMNFPD